MQLDPTWLAARDASIQVAEQLVDEAIKMLVHTSNAEFVRARGGHALAVAKLQRAVQALKTARLPW